MKDLPFYKYQALGNDFVLLELEKLKALGISATDFPVIAQKLCNRFTGIGSDGLLIVNDTEIIFHNPDGTIDQCGNGIRVAGFHTWRKAPYEKKVFSTLGGDVVVRANPHNGTFSALHKILSLPKKMTAEIIVEKGQRKIEGQYVDLGTPHFCVDASLCSFDEAKFIEHSQTLPASVSVDFLDFTLLDKQQVPIRIWERSVGETLGCGTGAMASALTAQKIYFEKTGIFLSEWLIQSKGGTLRVVLSPENSPEFAELTGAASFVFDGIYSLYF